MATIREVSKYANVSVATVSRVVNGNKWVSEATRAKVTAAMTELGYRPNSFAKALATNRSETFGMVVSDLGGPFFGDMMHYAEDAVRQSDKHLIITSGHDSVSSEQEAIDFLLQRRVDALLLHLDVLSDEAIIKLKDDAKIPIVLMNRLIPELSGQCISVDNDAGGYFATQHLIELGHRQIACITGPLYKADARARLSGYRRALEQANIEYDENFIIEADYREEGGQTAIERLARRKVEFSAVFAQNDHMAIGAMTALKSASKRIPEDVSVVGFDDMVMARYVDPALTTVNVPVADIGRQSALLALRQCEGESHELQLRYDPALITRDSTGPIKSE